jgi:zinc/manganese transport system substrate-binding protein
MRLRIVLVCVLCLVLAGCGGSRVHGVRVVAAENVYGDIARQIGGAHVDVTSILTSPSADPHLYEPGTVAGLRVAQAQLVIQNGLGYDAFMTKLERAAPSSTRRVLTIADVLGVRGSDANPHLWYDVPQLPRIAGAIADALVSVDPAHATAYRRNRARFVASLAPLDAAVRQIRRIDHGEPVAYTEPVPGYLLAAAGLVNRAPAGFTRAIEDGAEPSPQNVSAMYDLVRRRRVRVLLYNAQAVSPITSIVQHTAQDADVPVVGVTETLPPHMTFQQWQLAQVRALARELAG